jgi:predicted nuclease of restriction endonuclease-like (RecB) superfamily
MPAKSKANPKDSNANLGSPTSSVNATWRASAMPAKKKPAKTVATGDFESLVSTIVQIHRQAQDFATKAVNIGLTLRNWLIGHRIVEFEQKGRDRAVYGERLLPTLAQRLIAAGLTRVDARELRRFRLLYSIYPQIRETLSPELLTHAGVPILQPFLKPASRRKRETPSPESQMVETVSPQLAPHPDLLQRLSFSHLSELLELPDETQRRFYEIECIRGNWSVRELRRQIASLYYERSGLSKNKVKLSAMAHAKAETLQPAQIIRDPYIFEFLGLRSQDTMGESDLEDALLDRLQDFLLEMGHGFCFEARQKRILIGDEHFFVDLVFYHRVLKCHVLVELKTAAFSHQHLGQLNTYVAYYKKHQMTPGDQPPIGILLCTRKNEALVEFALGDISNQLFVSRYAVEMPGKAAMEAFLKQIGKEVVHDS